MLVIWLVGDRAGTGTVAGGWLAGWLVCSKQWADGLTYGRWSGINHVGCGWHAVQTEPSCPLDVSPSSDPEVVPLASSQAAPSKHQHQHEQGEDLHPQEQQKQQQQQKQPTTADQHNQRATNSQVS